MRRDDPTLPEPEGVRTSEVPYAGAVLNARYRVDGLLGAGGMGVVLSAEDTTSGRSVAIKVPRDEALEDSRWTARFLQEARAVQGLENEHVVRVLDVGKTDEGAPFMVMERLRGHDLGELLAEEGPLPVETAVDYVVQASVAVAEAHSKGIVHRDLKPTNLFLTRREGEDVIKVLDFGVAKSLRGAEGGAVRTSTGMLMGSPGYMAPEQVRDSRKVDPRCDVWAFGVILYELVAGRLPFEGDSAPALLAAIAADPPVPLRDALPDAPAALEKVLMRCLEKNRAARYPDVAALVGALVPFAGEGAQRHLVEVERFLGPHALHDTLPASSSAPRLEDVPPRRRTWAVGLGVVVTAAIVIAFGVADSAPEPDVTPEPPSAAGEGSPAAAVGEATGSPTAPPTADADRSPPAEATTSVPPRRDPAPKPRPIAAKAPIVSPAVDVPEPASAPSALPAPPPSTPAPAATAIDVQRDFE